MSDWEIYDERFRNLMIGNAQLQKLHEGLAWAEGPVWFGDANCLLFSDIPNNRMLRLVDGNQVSIFRSPSNYTNGNTRDREGRLVSCQHGTRSVTRTEYNGSITTISDSHAGKRLNSPNDVIVAQDGAVWFSDPPYGILSDYEGHKAEPEQNGNYIFRVDSVTGKTEVAADDFDKPNGLCFSPDGKLLYVADSGASHNPKGPHHIRRFEVSADGKLSKSKVFADIKSGVPDGLRLDTEGNVWTSCADGVLCYAPDGAVLGKIKVPEVVANLCFGGPKRNRIFITACTSIYSMHVNARGAQLP